jgi:hypothetical protein
VVRESLSDKINDKDLNTVCLGKQYFKQRECTWDVYRTPIKPGQTQQGDNKKECKRCNKKSIWASNHLGA